MAALPLRAGCSKANARCERVKRTQFLREWVDKDFPTEALRVERRARARFHRQRGVGVVLFAVQSRTSAKRQRFFSFRHETSAFLFASKHRFVVVAASQKASPLRYARVRLLRTRCSLSRMKAAMVAAQDKEKKHDFHHHAR